MEITVKFYGNLKKFGSEFKLTDVANTAEVLRALYCQISGLRNAIQKGVYKLRIGKKYATMPTLKQDVMHDLHGGETIHLIPVVGGSGGQVQFVIGAVLAVVGYALSWTGVGAVVGTIGVGLMASGVASMLTKTPSPNDSNRQDEVEKKQSTAFSNLQNLVAQGRPVPLAYGKILVGSLVIGKGLETLTVSLVEPEQDTLNGKRGLTR